MISQKNWVISIREKLQHKWVMSNEKQQVDLPTPWRRRCIYKVPVWLKHQVCDGDATPYEPEIVSLGPYHHGKPHLREMDEHKWRCLQTMLTREDQDVEVYLEETRKLEADARSCYEGPLELDSDQFVEMLVLDGCFILEFLRGIRCGFNNLNYADDDPVLAKDSVIHVIGRDMIKLENQIPLMVLEKLLEIQYSRGIRKKELPKLVLRALTPVWVAGEALCAEELKTMRNAVASGEQTMLHCLDIFRLSLLYKPAPTDQGVEGCSGNQRLFGLTNNEIEKLMNFVSQGRKRMLHCLPQLRKGTPSSGHEPEEDFKKMEEGVKMRGSRTSPSNATLTDHEQEHEEPSPSADASSDSSSTCEETGDSEVMVYCVADLREAGVEFKKRRGQHPFWELNFDEQRGLLEIPPIKIDDATKTVFLNLIAYEQCHFYKSWQMIITDYVAFVDNLVNSSDDVGHLNQAGIIVHQLGSNAEVAELFNRLVKKAFINKNEGQLSNLYEQLNKYCSHRRHRWYSELRYVHLKNPWVILSIVAASIMFVLTILQSFYAVFAYHKPPKSD